jgi:hypothetical protein
VDREVVRPYREVGEDHAVANQVVGRTDPALRGLVAVQTTLVAQVVECTRLAALDQEAERKDQTLAPAEGHKHWADQHPAEGGRMVRMEDREEVLHARTEAAAASGEHQEEAQTHLVRAEDAGFPAWRVGLVEELRRVAEAVEGLGRQAVPS